MNVADMVRGLLDDSVGNAGAVRNCRTELLERRDAERQVEALCRRVRPLDDRTEQRDTA